MGIGNRRFSKSVCSKSDCSANMVLVLCSLQLASLCEKVPV